MTSTDVPRVARWAHLEGVGGYVFLDAGPQILADVSDHSGNWQRNNTATSAGTATIIHRQYATLAYTHGKGAAVDGARYAYVVLPTASRQRTRLRARTIDSRTVARNDGVAQAVRHGRNVLAANFWKPGTVDHVTADGPACVITRSTNRGMEVALSEPTQQRATATLTIRRGSLHRVTGPDADRVSLSRHGNVVTLVVDTADLGGRGLRFDLVH